MRLLFAMLLAAAVLASGCFHKAEDAANWKNWTSNPLMDKIKEVVFQGQDKAEAEQEQVISQPAENKTKAASGEKAGGEAGGDAGNATAANATSNQSAVTYETIMKGAFQSVNQTTVGLAWVYNLSNGTTILFLDDFWTYYSNNLYVYLSPINMPRTTSTFLANSTEISKMLSFKGDQNYTLKANPLAYKSVVIYDKSKKAIFGYATISQTEKQI